MNRNICVVENCEKSVLAKDLCSMHYSRLRRSGDIQANIPPSHQPQRQICIITDCNQVPLARNWCNTHYIRWMRYGDPLHIQPRSKPPIQKPKYDPICSIPDCYQKHDSKGLCSKHLYRLKTHGNPLANVKRRPDYKERPGCLTGDGYWKITVNGKYIPEHRHIMQESLQRTLESWETVHHINGDRLDNRLENLQLRSGQHGQGVIHECLDCGSNNIKSVEL